MLSDNELDPRRQEPAASLEPATGQFQLLYFWSISMSLNVLSFKFASQQVGGGLRAEFAFSHLPNFPMSLICSTKPPVVKKGPRLYDPPQGSWPPGLILP